MGGLRRAPLRITDGRGSGIRERSVIMIAEISLWHRETRAAGISLAARLHSSLRRKRTAALLIGVTVATKRLVRKRRGLRCKIRVRGGGHLPAGRLLRAGLVRVVDRRGAENLTTTRRLHSTTRSQAASLIVDHQAEGEQGTSAGQRPVPRRAAVVAVVAGIMAAVEEADQALAVVAVTLDGRTNRRAVPWQP
jgi:hypothetical protein